jgi:hypothetical protein
MMFSKDSARDTGLEFRSWSKDQEHRLGRRKALLHRRHLLARAREGGVALLLVAVSLWLAALAVVVVLH